MGRACKMDRRNNVPGQEFRNQRADALSRRLRDIAGMEWSVCLGESVSRGARILRSESGVELES